MTIEKIDFVERYVGIMSDGDIALELRTTIAEIRNSRKEFRQLCWTCKNACNQYNCSWVRRLIYPDYADIDDDGYIVKCERYEPDEIK